MKYKSFPQEFWDLVNITLDQVLANSTKAPVAAFDADGTLWDADLGENFFKWQIKNKVLKNLPSDPWRHYRDWKESGDPRPAYLWLAQINQGRSIQEVRGWASDCVKELSPLPVFEDQKKLIQLLKSKGVDIYVVTASVKWAVEPGAALLGIPEKNVIGVATKIKNGIVSTEQEGQITYREGKATAIIDKAGQKPFLSSGNTLGDIALLDCATHIKWCVSAAQKDHELWPAEEKLRQEAKAKNWLIHEF